MTVPLIPLTWTDERPAILGDTDFSSVWNRTARGGGVPTDPATTTAERVATLVTSLALIALIAAWIFITVVGRRDHRFHKLRPGVCHPSIAVARLYP